MLRGIFRTSQCFDFSTARQHWSWTLPTVVFLCFLWRVTLSYAKGDFDGVVHAVGMLFAGSLNRYASGSGSVPDPGTTYDSITRQTAFAATAALADLAEGGPQVRYSPTRNVVRNAVL